MRAVMIRCVTLLALASWTGSRAQMVEPSSEPSVAYNILLASARDANLPGGIPVRKLFDGVVRDPNITLGPDGIFYMVATTNPATGYTARYQDGQRADSQMWRISDGIRMWRSADLVHWDALGLIWSLDKDGSWAHWYKGDNPGVAVWAPEIHYLKGTWWIPYCATPDGHENDLLPKGLGLLKSTSGRPEGPYRDVKTTAPLGIGLDATLFQDDDGTVYYLYAGYNIARMKEDMSDFAESPREVDVRPNREWGEGVFLLKVDRKYVLTNSGTSFSMHGNKVTTTYDSYAVTSATSIYGPYTSRYRAIAHAGHNNYFQDRSGQWWSSYFGSGDDYAPWTTQPGVIPVKISEAGRISARTTTPWVEWKYAFERPSGNWSAAGFDDRGWRRGTAGFGDRSIMNSGSVSFVNTDWTMGEIWTRCAFMLDGRHLRNAALYLRYSGDVDVYVNGRSAAHLQGAVDDYITQPIKSTLLRTGWNSIAVHESAPAALPSPEFASEEERTRFGRKSFPTYRYLDVGLVEQRIPEKATNEH